jgi:DNA-binding transcriptional MerR regulator
MKMRELSAVSGLPVATIKFYVREGLLHAGRATSATQAEYDESHIERLRLIRVLREVGEMPLARIDAVVQAIEDERTPLADLIAEAHHALGPEAPEPSPELADARESVLDLVERRGWLILSDAPAIDALAAALVAVREMWNEPACGADIFDDYAEAAERIAEHELATVDPSRGRGDTVRQVITGTVVFERALVALRRLAQEHFSHTRFGEPARPLTSARALRSRGARDRTPGPAPSGRTAPGGSNGSPRRRPSAPGTPRRTR